MGLEKRSHFVKLYEEELSILLGTDSVDAIGVYYRLRKHAFVDKTDREKSYWSFPGQVTIGAALGWWDSNTNSQTIKRNQRRKIKRAVDRLIDAGLIVVYRPLQEIESERSATKSKKEKRELSREYQESSQIRDQLFEWGKACGSNVIVYELLKLRQIEGVAVEGQVECSTEGPGEVATQGQGGCPPRDPKEEECNTINRKNNIIINEEYKGNIYELSNGDRFSVLEIETSWRANKKILTYLKNEDLKRLLQESKDPEFQKGIQSEMDIRMSIDTWEQENSEPEDFIDPFVSEFFSILESSMKDPKD
jgi:hypothetical protein